MKIGDEVAIHGFIDEIRKDTVIIRNEGGYFGTISKEIQNADVFAKALPKGQWERHYLRPGILADLFWYCSNCGEKCGYDWANLFKFCSNCGADMRQKKAEPQERNDREC